MKRTLKLKDNFFNLHQPFVFLTLSVIYLILYIPHAGKTKEQITPIETLRLCLVGGMERVKDGLCMKYGKLIDEDGLYVSFGKIGRKEMSNLLYYLV